MDLLDNPFFILGATMRDNKRKLVDLAEQTGSDEEMLRNARIVLTNPRRRIKAEIGWLPGLGPKRISETISTLQLKPNAVTDLGKMPALARCNLLANGIVRTDGDLSWRELAKWIGDLADTHEQINVESTVTMLNEERTIADFPEISDFQAVEDELQELQRHYKQSIMKALNKLPVIDSAKVLTLAVDEVSDRGNQQAPALMDELVDRFEIEHQEFLVSGLTKIRTLLKNLREVVQQDINDGSIPDELYQFEYKIKEWDLVAQPIQVSARSRGKDHELSTSVSNEIRDTAIEIANEHGCFEIAKTLTDIQKTVFAEDDFVVERMEEDSSILSDLVTRSEAWNNEMSYETPLGFPRNKRVRISPAEIEWNGQTTALKDITRIRWGGVKDSWGSTNFSIYYDDPEDLYFRIIETTSKEVFENVVDRLWKSVGSRLLTEMLETLRAGTDVSYADAVVSDSGVILTRKSLFKRKHQWFRWADVIAVTHQGSFHLIYQHDRKFSASLSYLDCNNVHILETAVRLRSKQKVTRLSDIMEH